MKTFEDDAMLTGNCVALLTPFIIVPILTFIFKPQNFDWKLLDQRITRVDEEEELLKPWVVLSRVSRKTSSYQIPNFCDCQSIS